MKTIGIEVAKTIRADCETLYHTWLDPRTPGGPWFGVAEAIVQPVEDGLFYHCVRHQGRDCAHYGRFLALEPPRRASFTWVSEATKGLQTTVELVFEPEDGATRVTLRHVGVPDDESGRGHRKGWSHALDALAQAVKG